MVKALIFDSSTIITLALNNLLYILKELKARFKGRFLITDYVKREIIDVPLQIKRFELEALATRQLLDDSIIELPEAIGIKPEQIKLGTINILETANKTFHAGNWMRIIGKGEASCFALGRILQEKGIKNVLAIDERTARMLSEKPENLHKLLEIKLHTKIKAEHDNFATFNNFKIIRSAELCYLAYKYKMIEIKDGLQLLDAMLYATKFKGCSISRDEIEALKQTANKNI